VPRDRNGSFTPQLMPKGSRRLGSLDEMIISLYAGGMTLRDIQRHLVATIGHRAAARDDLDDHRPGRPSPVSRVRLVRAGPAAAGGRSRRRIGTS
jgi:hypothetical protein